MLAEQSVDIEGAADVLGRIDGADLDMGALVGGEHLLQILAADREDLAAGQRIGGDAALEVDQLAGLLMLLAFAEEIDLGEDRAALAVGELEAADVGEQPALAGLELDVAADLAGDGDARIGVSRDLAEAAGIELDLAAAAADLDDLADRGMARRTAQHRPHGRREILGFLSLREAVEVDHVRHNERAAPVALQRDS